jgi:hypothetical protein
LGVPAQYEGTSVTSDPLIVQAMAPALQRVHQLQATTLGGSLDAPIRRGGDLGSPLGNVFADALRDAVPAADVAVINNATRGLWADFAYGPITFGRLYDVFPFDNRVVRITLSGAELGRWLAGEIQQGRRGGLGISGLMVRVSCVADRIHVDLRRAAARLVRDTDRLLVVTIGSPTLSGSVALAAPAGGIGPTDDAPVVREIVEDWLRRPGHLVRDRLDDAGRRLEDADAQTVGCIALHLHEPRHVTLPDPFLAKSATHAR